MANSRFSEWTADKILVIDGGRIAQSGTHEELAAVPGIYRDMVEIQGKSAGWLGR